MVTQLRHDTAASAFRATLVGVAAVGSLVALYVVFVRTSGGQRLDQVALDHLGGSVEARRSVSSVLDAVSIGGMAFALAGCVLVALLRRRWSQAVAAVVLVAGSIGTTELLKHHLLTRPSLGYGGTLNSLPSGHTTVMVSLVMAALLVAPRAGRGVIALAGSIGVAVTGVATIVASWHRPSDVVAAFAVSLAWGALVLVALTLTHRTETSAPPAGRLLAGVAALPVAAGIFVSLGVRPDGTQTDLLVHVVIMSVVATLGAAVVAVYTLMVDTRLS